MAYRVCSSFNHFRSLNKLPNKCNFSRESSKMFSKDLFLTVCKSKLLQHARYLSQSAGQQSLFQRQQSQENETAHGDVDPYKVETEKCILCKYQVPVSYKNVQLLSQFVSPNTGRIFGRHITRLCHKQQTRVTKAIKRAVQFGYMPNQHRETRFLKDPSLYDVRYTGNPSIGQYSQLPDSSLSEEERLEMKSEVESDLHTKS